MALQHSLRAARLTWIQRDEGDSHWNPVVILLLLRLVVVVFERSTTCGDAGVRRAARDVATAVASLGSGGQCGTRRYRRGQGTHRRTRRSKVADDVVQSTAALRGEDVARLLLLLLRWWSRIETDTVTTTVLYRHRGGSGLRNLKGR